MSPSEGCEPGTRAQISDSERLVGVENKRRRSRNDPLTTQPPNLFRPATTTSGRLSGPAVHRSSLSQFPLDATFEVLTRRAKPSFGPARGGSSAGVHRIAKIAAIARLLTSTIDPDTLKLLSELAPHDSHATGRPSDMSWNDTPLHAIPYLQPSLTATRVTFDWTFAPHTSFPTKVSHLPPTLTNFLNNSSQTTANCPHRALERRGSLYIARLRSHTFELLFIVQHLL
ncbi:hypothetical protein DFH06DRAFT_1131035 [Mycena polygramma]|nr:hypothetical protein DFH06DRAFT_1131035 [Mycena polygramma]